MEKQKLSNGNYAAINIGSNAIRLLIKHVSLTQDGISSTKEQLIRIPLRLGLDVFTNGKISKNKEKKLCKLIISFAELMKVYDVMAYKACATSAIRDAVNGEEVVSMIKKKTGIRIKILSGKEEAKLIYNTHSDFVYDRKIDYLYVDVGGGSTEVNLIVDSRSVFSNSYNIGTIRVLSDTVDPQEWFRMESDLKMLAKSYKNINLLGSGGNINKLYRLVENRDKKQQRMTVEALRTINEKMYHLSFEERIRQYNLKRDRADVILPACHVFLTIADLLSSQYIYVPTIGLSDGMIDRMIYKRIKRSMEKLQKESVTDSESLKSLSTSEGLVKKEGASVDE